MEEINASPNAQPPIQGYRNHEKSGKHDPIKVQSLHSKLPVTEDKAMAIDELSYKEFKMIILKMLRELQENRDKQFSKIRKTTQEQNEKFNKEIENIKKNQTYFGAEEYHD